MTAEAGSVQAPGLRETAEIWWDSDADPRVAWDASARRFWLVDGAEPANTLLLWRPAEAPADPRRMALALADGLAACDFPPTGEGASTPRTAAALRVAGLPHEPAADPSEGAGGD